MYPPKFRGGLSLHHREGNIRWDVGSGICSPLSRAQTMNWDAGTTPVPKGIS